MPVFSKKPGEGCSCFVTETGLNFDRVTFSQPQLLPFPFSNNRGCTCVSFCLRVLLCFLLSKHMQAYRHFFFFLRVQGSTRHQKVIILLMYFF